MNPLRERERENRTCNRESICSSVPWNAPPWSFDLTCQMCSDHARIQQTRSERVKERDRYIYGVDDRQRAMAAQEGNLLRDEIRAGRRQQVHPQLDCVNSLRDTREKLCQM
jgi:hypothetical protein